MVAPQVLAALIGAGGTLLGNAQQQQTLEEMAPLQMLQTLNPAANLQSLQSQFSLPNLQQVQQPASAGLLGGF